MEKFHLKIQSGDVIYVEDNETKPISPLKHMLQCMKGMRLPQYHQFVSIEAEEDFLPSLTLYQNLAIQLPPALCSERSVFEYLEMMDNPALKQLLKTLPSLDLKSGDLTPEDCKKVSLLKPFLEPTTPWILFT